jgi:hypothetical protein
MSTVKVDSIKHTSTDVGGIVIDGSGHVTVDDIQMPTAGPLSNRNLIINGAMQVAQRATSATGLTNGSDPFQTVDRFRFLEQGAPTYAFTMTQSTDAPVGFSKSLKLECTTAQGSLAAGDVLGIDQYVEAHNLQQLNYGTSDAKTITLSFWVKSNKTGTFVAFFYGDDSDRSCTHSYTINAVNTWEYKTITVAGDTAGVINDDNGRGLAVRWYLASGTTYSSGTASTTYQTDVDANRAAGLNVNLADTVSNTWQITGVQLEVGSKATPFEHRSYGDELARCQRYYEVHGVQLDTAQNGSGTGYGTWYFKQTKRATPSTSSDSGGIFTGTNVLSSTGWQIYGSASALRMTVNAFVSSEL